MNRASIKYFEYRRKSFYYCIFLYFFLIFQIIHDSIHSAHAEIADANKLQNSSCPPGWIPFTENKCVKLSSEGSSHNKFSLMNYEQANEYCKSLSGESRLISLSNNEVSVLLEALSSILWKLIKADYNPHTSLFLTSGLREGSQWMWTEDRVALEVEPAGRGEGRCVALTFADASSSQNQTNSPTRGRLQMVNVDCIETKYLALCETNFAMNCTSEDGQYEGNITTSSSGMLCLQWTDPLITQTGYFCPQQKLWKHNYCRNLNNLASQNRNSRPWCMVSPTAFQECDVPFCKTAPKPVIALQPCAKEELRCGFSEQCVRSDYWCDYEVDCKNGFDEAACTDYLGHFQLVGQYKLVDKVTEIWTNIPHVQSCAKKCLNTPPTNTTFHCESFCYEPAKELCMLSQQTNNPAVIFQKTDSVYYQRKLLSETLINYTLQPKNNVMIARKGGVEAPICLDTAVDSNINDGLAVKLCQQAGYSLQVSSPLLFSNTQSNSLAELPISANDYYWSLLKSIIPALTLPSFYAPKTKNRSDASAYWTAECLHSPSCFLKPTKNQPSCQQFLACSICDRFNQFTCRSSRKCIQNNQVCDGNADCPDRSDENGCAGPLKWSLGSGQTEGRVQLYFQGELGDVCMDSLQHNQQHIEKICAEILGDQFKGRILPVGQQTPTILTWHVNCSSSVSSVDGASSSSCRIARTSKCISGILNLKYTCGQQQSNNSRDLTKSSSKSRVTRIVGGFNTRPGQYPWTASLKLKLGNAHHCGAAIITHRFLLTAAHCFQDFKEAKDFFVVTGDWDNGVKEGGEQSHNLSAIHFHPQFNQDLFQHDIAILELATDNPGIAYTNVSQPICLPPRGFQYLEGQVCTVTGWGSNTTEQNDDSANNYPKRMQAAQLPILNKEECKNVSQIYAAVGPTSFCAGYLANGGVDSCQGDSGGPFACEYNGHFYLAGIISWGEGCAQKGHPGIYTMLTPYLSWIETITKTTF